MAMDIVLLTLSNQTGSRQHNLDTEIAVRRWIASDTLNLLRLWTHCSV